MQHKGNMLIQNAQKARNIHNLTPGQGFIYVEEHKIINPIQNNIHA